MNVLPSGSEQIAEALDTASETGSRYESGRVPLSVTMLYRVAAVLDIRIEALLGQGQHEFNHILEILMLFQI